MRVGINGLGRIGRLALRAAMGGVARGDEDPRANGRLEVVHANELKGGRGGGRPSFGVRQRPRPLARADRVRGRLRARHRQPSDRLHVGRRARRGALGRAGLRHRSGMPGKFLRQEQLQGYFDRGAQRVIVAAPVKDGSALNIRGGCQSPRGRPLPPERGSSWCRKPPSAGDGWRGRSSHH
jgi:glyceraldehyde 3-phosphate dehydrogenase